MPIPFRSTLSRFIRGVRRPRVAYYPRFADESALASHLPRARWYLPQVDGVCESVSLFVDGGIDRDPTPPEYLGTPTDTGEHIRVAAGGLRFWLALVGARVIVVWDRVRPNIALRLLRLLGARIVYVPTDEPEAKEFGVYPSILWNALLEPRDREAVIAESRVRFLEVVDAIRRHRKPRACVFGTGPSLEEAYNHDFSNAVCIVCNSIVQNDRLLDHLQPRFICAGDAVSHFGPATYAYTFRDDLRRQLLGRDLYMLTTARFGYLLLAHHPELRERVFLVEQGSPDPVYDLTETYVLPNLDSTVNIHMLPLAATLCDEICVLGCDGKKPEGNNEDFWAHAKDAQYHGEVDSTHLAHPTFDVLRQQSTYQRHLDSVAATLDGGEAIGKTYRCLAPSNISAFQARYLNGKATDVPSP